MHLRRWVIPPTILTFNLLISSFVPPIEDELYYWCWAKDLQLSYFDHPPMTAYLIRLSTMIFGDTDFGVRFPACLSLAIVLGLVMHLTPSRSVVFGLLCLPVFTVGAMVMTPDTGLQLFWACYWFWMVRVHEQLENPSERLRWSVWMLGGVILGLGLLSKYTMALAGPAGLFGFLLLGWSAARKWWLGYLLHGIVAFVVSLPILIFNIQHDFIPLKFQWDHSNHGQATWVSFGSFLGLQIVLVGTMPLALLPWVAWRFRSMLGDPRLRVCAVLYFFPLCFFLYKSMTNDLQPNWALASYISFWPLAAKWFADNYEPKWLRWLGRCAFLIPGTAVLLLTAHLLDPLSFVPKDNRITRIHDLKRLIQDLREYVIQENPGTPVFSMRYQWVSLMRYHGVKEAHQEPGRERASQFTLIGPRLKQFPQAYLFSAEPADAVELPDFHPPVKVKTFSLFVRGTFHNDYHLWLYKRRTLKPHAAGSEAGR